MVWMCGVCAAVNPQCLGLPLSLECLFRVSPRERQLVNKVDSIRGNINVPISAWAAAAGQELGFRV